MTDKITHLAGPVEEDEQGRLVLRIPLYADGDEFIRCTRGISEIQEPCLVIILPPWLVKKLNLSDGSQVAIDNTDGEFNMQVLET